MLVAHLVSHLSRRLDVMAQLRRRIIQEREMMKPELNRITAALRNLTPMQRRVVTAELASLDKQQA